VIKVRSGKRVMTSSEAKIAWADPRASGNGEAWPGTDPVVS